MAKTVSVRAYTRSAPSRGKATPKKKATPKATPKKKATPKATPKKKATPKATPKKKANNQKQVPLFGR